MEFYQKIKKKIAEEFEEQDDEEVEDPRDGLGAQGGPGSGGEERLRQEIRTLKEHINSNYAVYVKRLDKRKARIKELEEYTKLVLRDNETLQEKVKETEGYKQQLSQTRESLEQLEGFQNQELSKVKHMLLSAETALEAERSKRQSAQQDLEQSQRDLDHLLKAATDIPQKVDGCSSPLDLLQSTPVDGAVVERLKVHIQDLEARLKPEPANDEVGDVDEVVKEMREKMKKLQGERDAAKSSLIEVEIARHEAQEQGEREVQDLKMKVTQLTTEKETLEVTLSLRDNELKSKKEESRAEKEKNAKMLKDLEKLAEGRSERISKLELENDNLKLEISETKNKLASVENEKIQMFKQLEYTLEESASKDRAAEGKDAEIKDLEGRFQDLHNDFEDLVALNHTLENNLCQVKDNSLLLQQNCDKLTEENASLSSRIENLSLEVSSLNQALKEAEDSFPERLESSSLVTSLRESNQSLLDELAEKKQSVKLLQGRMNDMKKTFQKELKDSSESSKVPERMASPVVENGVISGVDLVYLKHVFFKFLTSSEYEAKQLIKALGTLLHFTPDELKLLSDHLEWKMSWFGSKPDLGTGQFSLSIDH